MTTNYLDPDEVSNAYYSSQQAAFPVSNLYNAQRRSKVWRSAGYWEITDSNNTVIFRETASGPDLTATIAAAEYVSTASFLAAVKAAFEETGDSTYTVETDDETSKIKISSDGAGGDTTFSIFWTAPASQAFADIIGFDSEVDSTGALSYTADELKIHTSEWLKWDFGISTNPKALVLIGPRNSPIRISPSATLKLQANETNVWTSPTFEQDLSYDDVAIGLFDSEGLFPEGKRYAKLKIIDSANPNGFVELGSVFLGEFFQPTRGAVNFPLAGRYVDRSTTAFSEGGQTFSDRRAKSEILDLTWKFLTKAEKEEIDDIFDEFGTSDPFFIQLDPTLAFSTKTSKYVRYVKFDSEPRYSLETPNNFQCSMTLREEL